MRQREALGSVAIAGLALLIGCSSGDRTHESATVSVPLAHEDPLDLWRAGKKRDAADQLRAWAHTERLDLAQFDSIPSVSESEFIALDEQGRADVHELLSRAGRDLRALASFITDLANEAMTSVSIDEAASWNRSVIVTGQRLEEAPVTEYLRLIGRGLHAYGLTQLEEMYRRAGDDERAEETRRLLDELASSSQGG